MFDALPIFLLLTFVIALPVIFHFVRIGRRKHLKVIEQRLCKKLFPGEEGENLKNDMIENMMTITNGRFSEDEILDYYLKIKGLQIIDINSFGDSEISNYLMQPTRIRLRYRELVSFYETYLNQPLVHGQSAVGQQFSPIIK